MTESRQMLVLTHVEYVCIQKMCNHNILLSCIRKSSFAGGNFYRLVWLQAAHLLCYTNILKSTSTVSGSRQNQSIHSTCNVFLTAVLGWWQIMNCRCLKTYVVEIVPHTSVKYKLLFMCLQKKIHPWSESQYFLFKTDLILSHVLMFFDALFGKVSFLWNFVWIHY